MLAQPSDPYDLLGGNWIEDDPSDWLRLSAMWLESADVHAQLGEWVADDPNDDGAEELLPLFRIAMGMSAQAAAAESRAARMAETARLVITARRELTRLVRNGTSVLAAGNGDVDGIRAEIARVRAAYDREMSRPGRQRREPLLVREAR